LRRFDDEAEEAWTADVDAIVRAFVSKRWPNAKVETLPKQRGWAKWRVDGHLLYTHVDDGGLRFLNDRLVHLAGRMDAPAQGPAK